MSKLTACLWFDTEGEEAARFYTSVFPNSRITGISHYGEAGPRGEAGSVMTVDFELDGHAVSRAERRPGVHVQRGDLVPGQLRGPRRRSTATGRRCPTAARRARAAG